MFIFNRKYYLSLQQAIRIAILQHKPVVLKNLLDTHGMVAFSKAISAFSPRLIADVLAMLPLEERKCVIQHLSRKARHKLESLDKSVCRVLSHQPSEESYLKA